MSAVVAADTTLQSALDLASQGLPVFPCNPKDKAPLVSRGFYAATRDPDVIRAWFDRWPNALIGVPTGDASNIDAVDTDPRNGCGTWFEDNSHRMPVTRIHTTSGGGKHTLFGHAAGLGCSNDTRIHPGIDVKADGGYIIWHPASGCEVWLDWELSHLAEWPGWLLPLARAGQRTAKEGHVSLADRLPPSGDAVVALLDRMPNPLDADRGIYTAVMPAAQGCIDALNEAGTLGDDDESRIGDAAVAWAERWEGRSRDNETDEREKWERDWSTRHEPLAGWQTLEKVACALIPSYRLEQAQNEFSAVPPPAGADQPKAAPAAPAIMVTRPFVWRDPSTIPPREWIYGGHYIRRYLTATVAPGALGKSSHALVEAIDMVTGRGLLTGKPTDRRFRVSYWNGEDPLEEIERRVAAICVHYNIRPDEIEGRLFLNSGRDAPITLAVESRDGFDLAVPVRDALLSELQTEAVDVLILDPFVATHGVSENDNNRINAVARQFAFIADKANISIELIHHTRKGQMGQDQDVDDARGAKALTDAARSVRVLNTMQTTEAESLGITAERRRRYFRVDDAKTNLVPPSDNAAWRHLASVNLCNATERLAADHVGVVEGWTKPAVTEGVTPEHLATLRKRLADGEPNRKDVRADRWVGHTLAAAMGLGTADDAGRKRITAILKDLIRASVLTTGWTDNGKGRQVECITGVREGSL